jgi:hypothetical protein
LKSFGSQQDNIPLLFSLRPKDPRYEQKLALLGGHTNQTFSVSTDYLDSRSKTKEAFSYLRLVFSDPDDFDHLVRVENFTVR